MIDLPLPFWGNKRFCKQKGTSYHWTVFFAKKWQEHQKTYPKIWFKDMIYLSPPVLQKKTFLAKNGGKYDLPCFCKRKGQVDHIPPSRMVEGSDLPGLFWAIFGPFLGPKRLFLLFGGCCFYCCFVLFCCCCFVVIIGFLFVVVWLLCCCCCCRCRCCGTVVLLWLAPEQPREKH